jgi:release factor glutamine methyltransferase
MQWTIAKILDWAAGYFSEKGIDSPRLDAELLLGRALDLERVQLYVQFDRPLEEAELAGFKALVRRRASREPLAYILGTKEFYSLAFQVTPAVLIPRPETEELVERGLRHLKQYSSSNPSVLDLATGSGCILISILKNFPAARGMGVDVSAAALELARQNAVAHGLADRISWIPQDLHQTWPSELQGPFALITANLPYVSEGEYSNLEPELRDHEPRIALVPGPTGTEAFAWVLPQLAARLLPGGLALLEMGMEQGEPLLRLAQDLCPGLQAKIHQDLAGRNRFLALNDPRPCIFNT